MGARVTFSLNGQRESNPRERPPRWRALRPSMGFGCADGLRGFPTARPCAGGKLARIHAGHPADFPSPTRRAIGAPGEAARSCAQKQRQQHKQEHPTPALPCTQGREKAGARSFDLASASAFAVASGTQDARLLLGPLGGGEVGTARPRSGRGQDGLAFSHGQDARSKSPGPASRTCRPWRDGKRQPGCRFLLATSLLDKQKRSSSGAQRAHETALTHKRTQKPNPPSPQPSPPTISPSGERESIRPRKEKVARAATAVRNRFETRDSKTRKAPLPHPSPASGRRERSPRSHKWERGCRYA